MINNRLRNSLNQVLFATLLVAVTALPTLAANLNLKYEQAITDIHGNEIGIRTYILNSPKDLPVGSQWRDYLNTKMPNGKTIYEYASSISNSLSQDLNLTISDRDSNSYTAKGTKGGYTLNIYNYVNDFASDSSKSFLFLHEFGHVTMLNSYPKSYDFRNLDYGSDNRHYLDEILPNYNTAWVEGWANAFAAANNNGMVFSYDLKNKNCVAFLKENTFDEMTRNEVFVGKVLYDSFKDIKGGQAAAYDVFAKSAPHYSLEAFCQKYVKLYPQNQIAMAKILVENSQGKISLNELLAYVNGGSNQVTKEFYSYLAESGMLSGNAATNYQNNNYQASKPSFFSRLLSWFKGIFSKDSDVANSPKGASGASNNDEQIYNRYTDGNVAVLNSMQAPDASFATAPESNSCITIEGNNDSIVYGQIDEYDGKSIAEIQELYYKYFNEYNKLMSDSSSSKQDIREVRAKMVRAKNQLKKLQSK